MTVPFAPYESVPDDDLGATAIATLAISLGGLLAISLGVQAWRQIPAVKAGLDAPSLKGQNLATVLTTVGWGAAAVLLGLGALLLVFRRGRGTLVLGALLATATTAVARYGFQWFTPTHPMDNALVYWGGVALLVIAALPAVGRWVAGRGRSATEVMTATPTLPTSATGVVSTVSPAGDGRTR